MWTLEELIGEYDARAGLRHLRSSWYGGTKAAPVGLYVLYFVSCAVCNHRGRGGGRFVHTSNII